MKPYTNRAIVSRMLALAVLLCSIVFTGCSNAEKDKANRSLNEFKRYVKEHKDDADKYAEEKWEDIEREYQEKKVDLDKNVDKMDREMKESYNNAVADWEDFKNDMQERKIAREQKRQEEELIRTFTPEPVMTDMSNITGKNIASVYIHFFDAVEKNQDTYSKEEWTSVNNYWKRLNDIRDRLDESGSISREDNKKINEIRVKYAATKTFNKPFAEGAK